MFFIIDVDDPQNKNAFALLKHQKYMSTKKDQVYISLVNL